MSRAGSEGHALRLSAVEEDILTLLVGRELYGLAIIEASKSAVGGSRALRLGSLYTALYKMEKKGLVRSWWGSETPDERGHARRRYYTATGSGRRGAHGHPGTAAPAGAVAAGLRKEGDARPPTLWGSWCGWGWGGSRSASGWGSWDSRWVGVAEAGAGQLAAGTGLLGCAAGGGAADEA